MMMKTLIAGVTAVSLISAPASAQEMSQDDIGKLLFGLAAAITLGVALNKDNDRTSVQTETAQPEKPRHAPRPKGHSAQPGLQSLQATPLQTSPGWVRPGPRHGNGWTHPQPRRGQGWAPPKPGRGAQTHMILPGECFRSVETRFGTQNVFGRRCLTQTYRHAAQLPQRCAVRIVTSKRAVNGFDPLCLRQHGFTSTRGRR